MLTGSVDWYNPDGYGVIRDDQGRDYFVHHSGLLPAAGGRLSKGQRVTFQSRPRTQRPGTLEAFDVAPAPATTAPATAPVTAAETQAALEAAASEVLRIRRERRAGAPVGAPDPFARDARIVHPEFGAGQVILSTRTTVTVEFDSGQMRGFSRSDLVAALAQPAGVTRQVSTATPFSRFMETLRRETQADLLEEGLDTAQIYRAEPAREAEAGAELAGLDARVRQAFAREGITSFYSHQVQSHAALTAGRHVVLCTPTASGKTASFTPAILEHLLRERGATALYVFPLVALAGDQTGKLLALNAHFDDGDRLRIGVLNSSVGADDKRETMRANNDIVVTTPDTLHYRLLPNSAPNWTTFFKNLRYLVLDEAHIYKGAFGSNVANIVRRVVARCYRLSGRAPQIVVASATVRDPLQLALQLTGYKADTFTVIDKSGARTPRRHMLITRESAQDLCTELLAVNTREERTGTTRPVRVIVFTRSINAARNGCARLREHLAKSGRADLAGRIADYYSDKSDKNDTFARLRAGEIQCIYSTTALMAGIDIGSLDVVIVDGFPGLVMDARQMFGRAGRASEGAAIFVAHRGDPFDEFYLENPDLLFKGATEPVIANPENPLLLGAHLLCAARTSSSAWQNEGPLNMRALRLFGEAGPAVIDVLEQSKQIELNGNGLYNRIGKPHDSWPLSDLRATNDKEPLVLQTRDGRELEKKRRALAYRDTHPGATFVYDGRKYRVTRFPERTDRSNLIVCEPVVPDPGVWTQGVEEFAITIEKTLTDPQDSGGFTLALGDVSVQTTVASYRRVHTRNQLRCTNRRCRHETTNLDLKRCPKCGGAGLRQRQVDEPEPTPIAIVGDYDLTTVLQTQAAWLDLKPALRTAYAERFWPRWRLTTTDAQAEGHPAFACAVASAMSAVLKAFPECANCDRDDVAAVYAQSDTEWRMYFYDHFPRGLGIAAEFSRDPQPYLEIALETIERCSCNDEGCPVCLHNFRIRQQSVLSKLGARFLLRQMLGLDTQQTLSDLQDSVALLGPARRVGS